MRAIARQLEYERHRTNRSRSRSFVRWLPHAHTIHTSHNTLIPPRHGSSPATTTTSLSSITPCRSFVSKHETRLDHRRYQDRLPTLSPRDQCHQARAPVHRRCASYRVYGSVRELQTFEYQVGVYDARERCHDANDTNLKQLIQSQQRYGGTHRHPAYHALGLLLLLVREQPSSIDRHPRSLASTWSKKRSNSRWLLALAATRRASHTRSTSRRTMPSDTWRLCRASSVNTGWGQT